MACSSLKLFYNCHALMFPRYDTLTSPNTLSISLCAGNMNPSHDHSVTQYFTASAGYALIRYTTTICSYSVSGLLHCQRRVRPDRSGLALPRTATWNKMGWSKTILCYKYTHAHQISDCELVHN